jgi:hypothetical protein
MGDRQADLCGTLANQKNDEQRNSGQAQEIDDGLNFPEIFHCLKKNAQSADCSSIGPRSNISVSQNRLSCGPSFIALLLYFIVISPTTMKPTKMLILDIRRPATKPTSVPRKSEEESRWRWYTFFAIGAVALLSLTSCANQSGQAAPSLQGKPLSGYVDMSQVQAAYIGSGSAGHGTLSYRGQTYSFSIGGLGVGGIGVSTIKARGEVYGLRHFADFPGAYAQIRYGFALGNSSAGDLWLQNSHGVILHLIAKRKGLMLSLGGDAIVISMNQ